MFCPHSARKTPCFIREPSPENCRACLKALAEHEGLTRICGICGADLEVWQEMNLGEHNHFKDGVKTDYALTPQSAGKK